MTPNSHYVAPLPPVTHIYQLSHRFHQAGRLWKALRPVRMFSYRALYYAGVLLFVVVPYVLKNPAKRLVAALLKIVRFIDRAANAILTFIYEGIITGIRALAAPLLALGLLFLTLFILDPANRQSIKNATPTLATLAHDADAKPLPAAVFTKQASETPPASRLARFHEPSQRLATERARIESLADALNIPPDIVKSDITRALELAHTNARAMRPHTGRFPLPKETSDRLLAALTPTDVNQLARLLEHATTIDKTTFTLNANLASGDLSLDARVTALSNTAATGACFRYALTFLRRTFRHPITITACRQRDRWSFISPKTKGQ